MNKTPGIFGKNLFGAENKPEGNKLEERFIVPPFTLLDSTSDTWRARRAAWEFSRNWKGNSDPVLIEVLTSWFCPKGGIALTSVMFDAAIEAAGAKRHIGSNQVFMDFYLEIFDPEDIGGAFGLHEGEFSIAIHNGLQTLNQNRFAVFVLPVVARESGQIYNIQRATIEAAEALGLGYLNEIIYSFEPKGAAPNGCPLTMHSTILVFCKGDARLASQQVTAGRGTIPETEVLNGRI